MGSLHFILFETCFPCPFLFLLNIFLLFRFDSSFFSLFLIFSSSSFQKKNKLLLMAWWWVCLIWYRVGKRLINKIGFTVCHSFLNPGHCIGHSGWVEACQQLALRCVLNVVVFNAYFSFNLTKWKIKKLVPLFGCVERTMRCEDSLNGKKVRVSWYFPASEWGKWIWVENKLNNISDDSNGASIS